MVVSTERTRMLNLALFSILLLSARPTDSARTQVDADGLIDIDADSFVHGDHSSCARLQEIFEMRANKAAKIGPNTTKAGMISVILRTWGMTSTLRRANNQDCAWTAGGALDISALELAVRHGLSNATCFPQAEALLKSSEGLPKNEQPSQFFRAVSVMLSPSCDDTQDLDMDKSSVGTELMDSIDVDDDRTCEKKEHEADNIAENLEVADAKGYVLIEDVLAQGEADEHRASFVEATARDGAEFPDIIQWGLSAMGFLQRVLPNPRLGGQRRTVTVDGQRITLLEDPVGGRFLQSILVALWVLVFAVTCYIITHVVAMVVKMVLCILRWLISVVFHPFMNIWSVQRCILRTLFETLHGNALNRPLRPLAAGACLAGAVGVVAVR